MKKPYKNKTEINDSYFKGGLSFSKSIRNRLIFFIVFCIYIFFKVLSVSDWMLLSGSKIQLPFVALKLPIEAFFVVVPLIVVALQFNLLYNLKNYKEYLLSIYRKYPNTIKMFPFGLYEGVLFKQESLSIVIKVFLSILIYIVPIIVIFSFWFRYTDYQNLLISWYQLIVFFLSFAVSYLFRNLFNINRIKINHYSKFIGISILIFCLTILVYQVRVVTPLSKKNITKEEVRDVQNFVNTLPFFNELLLPRLVVRNEVFVKVNEQLVKLPFELGQKLGLLYPIGFVDRNLNLADFSHSKFINVNFENVNLIGVDFTDTNLTNVKFQNVNMTNVKFSHGKLKDVEFSDGKGTGEVDFQGTKLYKVKFYDTNLSSSLFNASDLQEVLFGQNVYLKNTIFLSSHLKSVNFMNNELLQSNFNNSVLEGVNFTWVNLSNTIMQDSTLIGTMFGYVNLKNSYLNNTKLTGVIFINSDLQGVQFQNAILIASQMSCVNLSNSNFIGARMVGVKFKYLNRKTNSMSCNGWDRLPYIVDKNITIVPREDEKQLLKKFKLQGVVIKEFTKKMLEDLDAQVKNLSARQTIGLE